MYIYICVYICIYIYIHTYIYIYIYIYTYVVLREELPEVALGHRRAALRAAHLRGPILLAAAGKTNASICNIIFPELVATATCQAIMHRKPN